MPKSDQWEGFLEFAGEMPHQESRQVPGSKSSGTKSGGLQLHAQAERRQGKLMSHRQQQEGLLQLALLWAS